ncbi:DUF2783 domain-containing protein [Ferrovibrio sp.]|uniref:DUF2783 domain-containing protein n=1 Tax=Ferrovibrio sp. TaxID=1917215 RepID=UPI00311DF3D6
MNAPAKLNTAANIDRPDDFYQLLVDAHRDLAPEQSRLLNSKLILLLANHIGDLDILSSAIAAAKSGITPSASDDELKVTA